MTNLVSVPTGKGIRKGDSFSPLLYSPVMDGVITEGEDKKGCQMEGHNINIVCYAHDAVLISDTEDNLQRFLHQFNRSCRSLSLVISTEESKQTTISSYPL